jgi:hypothetical protein
METPSSSEEQIYSRYFCGHYSVEAQKYNILLPSKRRMAQVTPHALSEGGRQHIA